MIFGRHINRYYLRYGFFLLAGIVILVVEDYMMLEVPRFYQLVVNGINDGFVTANGATVPFDMALLLDRICMPLVWLILGIACTNTINNVDREYKDIMSRRGAGMY